MYVLKCSIPICVADKYKEIKMKKYNTPALSVVEIESADILTGSPNTDFDTPLEGVMSNDDSAVC